MQAVCRFEAYWHDRRKLLRYMRVGRRYWELDGINGDINKQQNAKIRHSGVYPIYPMTRHRWTCAAHRQISIIDCSRQIALLIGFFFDGIGQDDLFLTLERQEAIFVDRNFDFGLFPRLGGNVPVEHYDCCFVR